MKLNSKKIYKFLLLILFVVICISVSLFIIWKYNLKTPYENKLKTEATEVISKIELFKSKNGRLPKNLTEMGLPESEEGPIFYDPRKDGENYTVSFPGATLGESTYYFSGDQSWH